MICGVNPAADERDRRIMSLAPTVHFHACTMPFPSIDRRDIISAGWVGAIGAVDRYQQGSDASLRTFASHRIRGAMLDYLRQCDYLTRDHRRDIKNGLASQIVRVPIGSLIQDTLAPESFRRCERRSDIMILAEKAKLDLRSKDILRRRFWEQDNLEDIGAVHGIKMSRVSQIVTNSLLRLRAVA